MKPARSHTVHPPDIRVSTVELFFDLVFVFTITQSPEAELGALVAIVGGGALAASRSQSR
ncbi:MAG: hypothetical protein ACRDIC_16275 [bacterium]